MKETIYDFKWFPLFVVYTILCCGINWLTNTAVYTDAYYYSSMGTQLKTEKITDIIQLIHKYQIWGYIMIPILILLKWVIIAGVIKTGMIVSNQEISFARCYKITMIAELATIAGGILKLIHFLIHKPETTTDVQFFYPLSVTGFLHMRQLPVFLIYPLQQLNLIELTYWLLITAGIKVHIQKTFVHSFKITASTYGIAMVIWMLCIMFIQLQLN